MIISINTEKWQNSTPLHKKRLSKQGIELSKSDQGTLWKTTLINLMMKDWIISPQDWKWSKNINSQHFYSTILFKVLANTVSLEKERD